MAIKHNELRPGNYHKTAGLEIPRMDISSVKIDGQAFAAITAYGIYLVQDGKLEFEPIPLTEEWLLKYGFENKVDTKTYVHPTYRHHIIYTYDPNDDFKFKFIYRIPGVSIREVQYVHEIQNLYFAITGIELVLQERMEKV